MAPETMVFHLHRIKYDHRPLPINFGLVSNPRISRPFRFLSGWLTHKGFDSFVVENWHCDDWIEESVVNFTTVAKK